MRKMVKRFVCLVLAFAMLGSPAWVEGWHGRTVKLPGTLTVQAASKKVVKKANGYYSTQNKTGYWANKSYKTNGLKRIYKFNSRHYMSTASYKKMVKALKKRSYKLLKKAIGKGKLFKKDRSCSGGKYDYIYQYGSILVYVTDNRITLVY